MTYTSKWFCQTGLMKEETTEQTEVGSTMYTLEVREGRENTQYKNSEARGTWVAQLVECLTLA